MKAKIEVTEKRLDTADVIVRVLAFIEFEFQLANQRP